MMRLILIFALLLAIQVSPAWASGLEDARAGVVAARKGNIDEAIKLFSQAIQSKEIKEKKLAGVYFNRGNAHIQKNFLGKAIDDFTQAIKLNPKYSPSYNNRGSIYKTKGEHDKAIADFTKALEIAPKSPKTLNNRGFSYYSKGEFDKAIADFDKAVKIWPGFTEAYFNKGLTYGKKDNSGLAIENYQVVIRLLLRERDALRKNLRQLAGKK